MLPLESDVPAVSLRERAIRTTEMGTIGEVLGWLFPEVPKETGRAFGAFVQSVGGTMSSVDRDDGAFVVRGSTGHRIVYKSLTGADNPPSGSDIVRGIWKGLVGDSYYGLATCEEAHILADSRPDLDLVVDTSVDLGRAAREVAQIMPDLQVRVFTYAGIPIMEVRGSNITLEMHHLPDTDRLAGGDHRVSMFLPMCEAFSVAYIRPNRTVYVSEFSKAMLRNTCVSTGFRETHLTQAVVGTQRALSTQHMYQDAPVAKLADEYNQIGQCLEYYIHDPSFWNQARARSTHSSIDQRQTEMTFGFMSLLTRDPANLERHRTLFNQTHIGPLLDPDFTILHDSGDYQKAFRDGSLVPGESGVILFAKQLHLPVSKVIAGLRVRD